MVGTFRRLQGERDDEPVDGDVADKFEDADDPVPKIIEHVSVRSAV
jgi:hypothetical protein